MSGQKIPERDARSKPNRSGGQREIAKINLVINFGESFHRACGVGIFFFSGGLYRGARVTVFSENFDWN